MRSANRIRPLADYEFLPLRLVGGRFAGVHSIRMRFRAVVGLGNLLGVEARPELGRDPFSHLLERLVHAAEVDVERRLRDAGELGLRPVTFSGQFNAASVARDEAALDEQLAKFMEDGPDLEAVAACHGLSPEAVVHLHAGRI